MINQSCLIVQYKLIDFKYPPDEHSKSHSDTQTRTVALCLTCLVPPVVNDAETSYMCNTVEFKLQVIY